MITKVSRVVEYDRLLTFLKSETDGARNLLNTCLFEQSCYFLISSCARNYRAARSEFIFFRIASYFARYNASHAQL